MTEQKLPRHRFSFALIPSNPEVIRASRALRRKPETLIKNVQKYMSSPVEQALYIQIAGQFHHLPRVFKEILEVIQGKDNDLTVNDLWEHTNDQGEFFSAKVQQIEPMLEETLSLILRVPNDYQQLRLKASTAAMLVMSFGDDAISFIDSIMEDWCEIREILGFSDRSTQYPVARAAIWMWRNEILPYCRVNGIPDQLRFMDHFDDDCSMLRREEITDLSRLEDEMTEDKIEV